MYGEVTMERTSRYSDIVNNMNDYFYHILGCGAIGSSAAIQLARMGAENFALYDGDKVEQPNIGVSQYNIKDVGKNKVDCLYHHIINITEKRQNIDKYFGIFHESFVIDSFLGRSVNDESIDISIFWNVINRLLYQFFNCCRSSYRCCTR